MERLMLALDLGTTSVKAGLYSAEGRELASATEEYQLLTPSAIEAELPAETYWEASLKTLRFVIAKAGSNVIAGISISSQGETLIPVDKDGQALRNAIVWVDNRAANQAAYLNERLTNVYKRTGIPEVTPTWPACKILWMKEKEPELFARTHKFLMVQDYLIHRLTGRYVTNGSISCTTLYFDIVDSCWWQDALNEMGIDENLLPEILEPGEIVAPMCSEAVSQLGLSKPIVVIGGGMDQSVSAIGAGTISEGVVSETTGAALCIQMVTPRLGIDKNEIIPIYQHSIPGKYLFVPVCPTGGMSYKWFKDQFAELEMEQSEQNGSDIYSVLSDLAATVPAGSDGLIMLPHLMGAFCPYANPYARGAFVGFTLHHGKAHFIRAILEAIACLLRRNMESIIAGGAQFTEIRATGGGAKSPLWNQIKADMCNTRVVTLENENTGLIGNAILVGVACGIFKDYEEGCARFIRLGKYVYPDVDVMEYERLYRNYCLLDDTLDKYYRLVSL